MFLDKLRQDNSALLEYCFKAHKEGLILPDTYVLDYDMLKANAKTMLEKANEKGVRLYFMLKQIGRNPLIARMLMELGFAGCVAVDYKEALTMIDNGIKLGNVGHLVQIPFACLKKIVAAEPEVITVYSYEKIKEINEAAKQSGKVQPLLIRISDDDAQLYSGQEAGFKSSEIEKINSYIKELGNVSFSGITVFPALLYDEKAGKIVPTGNLNSLNRALAECERLGLKDLNINLPSATCCASIDLIADLKGTSGEPGHGLSGTTPLHKHSQQPEKVAYAYVSEVSHSFRGRSYCYGGGHYRRSHVEKALVGNSINDCVEVGVKAPTEESIDYHFELEGNCPVSQGVVMCFRTQIFTTRSHVAVVRGLSENKPQIMGIYDSLGHKIEKDW